MDDFKKILIISVSAGGGHIAASRAIKSYESSFDNLKILYIDLLDYMPFFIKLFYGPVYINIIRYIPSLHGFVYNITDKQNNSRNKIINKFKTYFQSLFFKKIQTYIKKINPDYLLFTHSFPAEHFNKILINTKFIKKCGFILTDYDVHFLEAQKNLKMMFVSCDQAKNKMIKLGVDKNRIFVTGIPNNKSFTLSLNKISARKKIKLNPKTTTILFMCGVHGVGRIDKIAQYLLKSIDSNFQIIALSGHSKKIYNNFKKLEKLYPNRIVTKSYTNDVNFYMSASDFTISKSGGLTTTECLNKGLPLITLAPIPGQEELNSRYLEKNKAGFTAKNIQQVKDYANILINNKKLLNEMQNNAQKIWIPNSAYKILEIINNSFKVVDSH